ncbi:MAG: TonB-dependent receptor [Pseudomonadota bacterium]
MTKKAIPSVRRSLLTATALTGVVAVSAPAFAQDDDTIIVTGSRLNQANLASSSPVFQVDAEEINTRGVTRIEDLINILPQAFAAQTSELANGANGTSTVNLRGLGAARTLVLMDGKRLPYSTVIGGSASQASTANLDTVPAQLVERVDVVSGGASALYGSDAVAGVVNFILRRDFEGLELDGQVGFFQDGNNDEFANALLDNFGIDRPGSQLDGRGVNVSATWGANTADGRGNVTAFFQYQDQNEIRQGARDYSACSYNNDTGVVANPSGIGRIVCGGSGTFRRIGLVSVNPNFDSTMPVSATNPTANPLFPAGLFLQEDGTLVPFTGAPNQLFNFAPDNFIQRNNERFNISAFARYEVTDNIEAYMDLSFTENTTDSQIAFSGTFFRNFTINCDNPFLEAAVPGPAGQNTVATGQLGCTQAQIDSGASVNFGGVAGPGYRNVNGNPRSTFTGLSTFRAVGGFRGTLGDNWDWDVFGQFSRTRHNSNSTGDLNFQAVQDAFLVRRADTDGDGMPDPDGAPVCISGNAGCLPLNLFQRPGGVDQITPQVAQSIQGNAFVTGTVEQIVLGGTISGDLSDYGFQFPLAESGILGLVGVEYREDRLDRRPDDVSQIPGGLGLTGVGGGTMPLQGEVSVWELFAETQIPLIEGKPFFEEFGINGAYRYSNYTTDSDQTAQTDFDTHTFAAGISWTPVSDLRFRGQFQRAVRAPNVFNLFSAQNTGLFNAVDPCSGAVPTATVAQCAFTGLPASQYGSLPTNPAVQENQVTGGNPLLNPEKSNTYTFGVVMQPRWIDGLTVSVDYFDISIKDAITAIPPLTTLTQCVTTGDPNFCSLVQRDRDGSLFASPVPPAGSPFQFAGVQATVVNVAQVDTRGIDVAASYGLDMADVGLGGWGSLNWNYVSTFLMEQSSIPVPGVTTVVECKGLYRGGCGGPNPEYRHRLLTTWQTPWNIDITATWRHFSGVQLAAGQQTGGTFAPTGNILDDNLDSAEYLDLAAQFYVRENMTLRAGVQNVFGRDPELSTLAGTAPGNGDTFPGTYDPAGRFIFFGVNLQL